MAETFIANVKAKLDTSNLKKSFEMLGNKPVTLKNITISTKGLASKIQEALNGQKFTLNLTNVKVDNLSKVIEGQVKSAGSRAGSSFSSSFSSGIMKTISTGGLEAKIATVTQKFNQLRVAAQNMSSGAKSSELTAKLKEVEKELQILAVLQEKMASGQLSGKSLSSAYELFNTTLLKVKNTLTVVGAETKEFVSNIKVISLSSQMENWLKKNSKAAKTFGNEIRKALAELKQGNVSPEAFSRIQTQFKMIDQSASQYGLKGKSFVDTFKNAAASISKYIGSATIIYGAIRELKQGVQSVIALDTALVDLRKTSNATTAELNRFYMESNNIAKSLGVTTQAVIQSAADWSRLGYSLKDAEKMSEVSSIFTAISPGMDIEKSTDGLVSAMKAFNIEADDALDGIASKINAIGNTQAVSNEDIVDFLTRSSSAMKEANNTLEETIALGTAATEITRNAQSVGTTLKTVSMRIRGYDEETEEFIGGVEKLSGDIADLTKTASQPGGISLFRDAAKTEYKSTYEFLRDISKIYDELSDKAQSGLLEKIAGKRNGQVVAAILNNFSAVESSLATMSTSAGSAMNEMGIIEESLEYKLNRLKETGVGIFQNMFQRGEISAVVDALTGILHAVDFLIDHLGLLGTTIAGIGLYQFIKNFD